MYYRIISHELCLNKDRVLIIGDDTNTPHHLQLIKHGEYPPSQWHAHDTAFESFVSWLHNYPHCIIMPPAFLLPKGTPFQQSCWVVIASIPYGETISYTELAMRVGNPSAIRAAASACGKNPLPLFIPCHRIIGKNGNLGGFAWGLPYKQRLLAYEAGKPAQPYP